MTKWTGRLKKLVQVHRQNPEEVASHKGDAAVDDEGWKYLNRVRAKLDKLVEDFSDGRVNRAQFEELYSHYQKERNAVERLMASGPTSDAWRMAVTEGQSINIRRRLAARVLGYAVFANEDQTPLRVYGEFASLDEKWIAPLLTRVRNDNLFAVDSFQTGTNGATSLCAVSGQFTTLLVLFSTEPARVQMQLLEDLHSHFEQANQRVLSRWSKTGSAFGVIDLVFPYAAAFE
jgi:hypothetical protein